MMSLFGVNQGKLSLDNMQLFSPPLQQLGITLLNRFHTMLLPGYSWGYRKNNPENTKVIQSVHTALFGVRKFPG